MTQLLSTPKFRAAGEGDRFQMLTHTAVVKIDQSDTQNQIINPA